MYASCMVYSRKLSRLYTLVSLRYYAAAVYQWKDAPKSDCQAKRDAIMILRKIIKINEALCNGCGNCVTACSEGAIRIVNGKAQVVSDKFCDGLGACIGECPAGALTIEERAAEGFSEEAVKAHLNKSSSSKAKEKANKAGKEGQKPLLPASCNRTQNLTQSGLKQTGQKHHLNSPNNSLGLSSQLSSWPIQMRLAHVDAPCFKDARLLIAADCSGFACPSIADFMKGKVVLIGCPKLDESGPFVEKLADILRENEVKEITILHMEVPCCSALVRLVLKALEKSQKDVSISKFTCMIGGSIAKDQNVVKT